MSQSAHRGMLWQASDSDSDSDMEVQERDVVPDSTPTLEQRKPTSRWVVDSGSDSEDEASGKPKKCRFCLKEVFQSEYAYCERHLCPAFLTPEGWAVLDPQAVASGDSPSFDDCHVPGCPNPKKEGHWVCELHLIFLRPGEAIPEGAHRCPHGITRSDKPCRAHSCSYGHGSCNDFRSDGQEACSEKHLCCVTDCVQSRSPQSDGWTQLRKQRRACSHHACRLCWCDPAVEGTTRCEECTGKCCYYTSVSPTETIYPYHARTPGRVIGGYYIWCGAPVVEGREHCERHNCIKPGCTLTRDRHYDSRMCHSCHQGVWKCQQCGGYHRTLECEGCPDQPVMRCATKLG